VQFEFLSQSVAFAQETADKKIAFQKKHGTAIHVQKHTFYADTLLVDEVAINAAFAPALPVYHHTSLAAQLAKAHSFC